MFGARYFGRRYFGPRYWGTGTGDVTPSGEIDYPARKSVASVGPVSVIVASVGSTRKTVSSIGPESCEITTPT